MQTYLSQLGKRSVKTVWDLIKIMLPIMVLVRLGEEFGLSDFLGVALEPLMGIVGLPAKPVSSGQSRF